MRFIAILLSLLLMPSLSSAQEQVGKIKVLTTFSILQDMAKNVGGDKVEVETIVPPGQDVHSYQLSPDDIKRAASAHILIANGLGFESWLDKLVQSSGFSGKLVIASTNAMWIPLGKDDTKSTMFKQKGNNYDPHAWQNLNNGRVYVANIVKGFAEADPDNEKLYNQNGIVYRKKMMELDQSAAAQFRKIPDDRRKMATFHDSMGYFARAYRIKYLTLKGPDSSDDISAQDTAQFIAVIRQENVGAIFAESQEDLSIMRQVASESGKKLSGRIYSDTLGRKKNIDDSYLNIYRHNVNAVLAAMGVSVN